MSYLFAPERFEADDFVLRSYELGDGALLAEAHNESYEHLRPWMAWATPQISVRDAERVARQARGRFLLWAKISRSPSSRAMGGRLLGGTGFHLRDGGIESGSRRDRHVHPSEPRQGAVSAPACSPPCCAGASPIGPGSVSRGAAIAATRRHCASPNTPVCATRGSCAANAPPSVRAAATRLVTASRAKNGESDTRERGRDSVVGLHDDAERGS